METPRFGIAVAAASLVLVGGAPAALADQKIKLLAGDAAKADSLGTSVALSATTAVVGTAADDDHGPSSGAVYLFDPVTGQELAKITPADGEAGDFFGADLALSGTTLIVGAFGDDDAGNSAGAAYLFDTVTLQQIAKLHPSDSGYNFGSDVAIHGAIAVVGQAYDDDNGAGSGSAYLFDAGTGQELAKLVPADNAAHDEFGASVAIAGNTVIVGAPGDEDLVGAVYVFDATTGQELAKLTADDATGGDQFGSSVALRGKTAVIGAEWKYVNGIRTGAAYLFDTATGQQLAKLVPDDGLGGERFGRTVALEGDVVLIGATGSDLGPDSGAVYRFDRQTGELIEKIFPADGKAKDGFGTAVAISGTVGLAGAPGDDESGKTNTGSAYVFPLLDSIGASYCGPATVNSSGAAGTITARGSLQVADNCVELHADGLAHDQFSMFLNSLTQGFFQPPGSQGFLCLGGSIGRYRKSILDTSPHGYVALELDLAATPTPGGPVAIQPGETWNFQLWFRDVNPSPTSNFTDGVSITFQ